MGQSSNDVFPSAVHLAAVDAVRSELLPALERLAGSFQRKADEWADVVKAGRTHMMDAVPVTLGQEFGGYAAQITLGRDRVQAALGRASEIPLGGTATGTGLNTHPEFAERVREKLGLGEAPRDRFEAQANRDALVELHGALKVVAVSLTKIANDLVLMGSGPRTGLVELQLPELQKGSSIMPGKVNPVIPEVVLQVAAQVIGNDTAVTVAGTQGAFELNVRVPVIARNLFESIRILTSATQLLAEKCVDGPRGERGGAAAPRRVDAGDRHGAEPAHRLRPRHRDRQRGGRLASARSARWRWRRASTRRRSTRRSTCARWRAGRRPSGSRRCGRCA